MKKLIYISFIFAFVLALNSCEKEVVEPFNTEADDFLEPSGTRGGEDGDKDDSVTDPDEDEDFDADDNIVDPDEDEDFDEEDDGK